MREFAGEQLDEHGERDAVSARLVAHLLAQLDGVVLGTPLPGTDNWRVAVDWGLARGAADDALALTTAGRVWRAEWPELIQRLEQALAERTDASPAAVGRTLSQLSIAHTVTGALGEAADAGAQAVALLRDHGSPRDLAEGLLVLGQAVSNTDLEAGHAVYAECLAVAREVGERRLLIGAMHALGELERERGDLTHARELLEQAIDMMRAEGLTPLSELHGLADVELEEGKLAAAAAAYRDVVSGSLPVTAWFTLASALGGLAAVAAAKGRVETAGRLWGGLERVEAEHGVAIGPRERERYRSLLARLNSDELAEHVAAGRALTVERAVEEALGG